MSMKSDRRDRIKFSASFFGRIAVCTLIAVHTAILPKILSNQENLRTPICDIDVPPNIACTNFSVNPYFFGGPARPNSYYFSPHPWYSNPSRSREARSSTLTKSKMTFPRICRRR